MKEEFDFKSIKNKAIEQLKASKPWSCFLVLTVPQPMSFLLRNNA